MNYSNAILCEWCLGEITNAPYVSSGDGITMKHWHAKCINKLEREGQQEGYGLVWQSRFGQPKEVPMSEIATLLEREGYKLVKV